MKIKDARIAIKKAELVLAFVPLNEHDGIRFKISKKEVLSQLENWDEDMEIFLDWSPLDSNVLLLN